MFLQTLGLRSAARWLVRHCCRNVYCPGGSAAVLSKPVAGSVTLNPYFLMLHSTSVSAQSTIRIVLPNFIVSILPDRGADLAITRCESRRSVTAERTAIYQFTSAGASDTLMAPKLSSAFISCWCAGGYAGQDSGPQTAEGDCHVTTHYHADRSASFLSAVSAGAAQLSVPQVEYSADSVMQTEEVTVEQHVFYTPTKERRETLGAVAGSREAPVQIIRKDTKVMWQVMPSEKMYMEHKIGQGKSKDMAQWDFEETVVGEEMMDGVKVTKYKTIATSTDGKKYGGFSWRTKEGIPIKTDLLYKEGNEKHRMMTELRNVKIGKQDPQAVRDSPGIYEIRYERDDGGHDGARGREGMGQPGTARPGMNRPGMNVPPEEVPANPEPVPPAADRSGMQKAGDMMKKLFGR